MEMGKWRNSVVFKNFSVLIFNKVNAYSVFLKILGEENKKD